MQAAPPTDYDGRTNKLQERTEYEVCSGTVDGCSRESKNPDTATAPVLRSLEPKPINPYILVCYCCNRQCFEIGSLKTMWGVYGPLDRDTVYVTIVSDWAPLCGLCLWDCVQEFRKRMGNLEKKYKWYLDRDTPMPHEMRDRQIRQALHAAQRQKELDRIAGQEMP